MATAAFSENWLKRLKATGNEVYYWDSKTPGLGMRMNSKGDRFFFVEYRVKGTPKKRRVALGRHGALTLEQARARATEFVSEALLGRDLKDERTDSTTRITFNELADRWLELHVDPKRAARTAQDYRKVLRNYLRPAFGKKATQNIKREQVLKLHQKMLGTPKVGNYAVIVGKMVFNFGLKNDLIEGGNPFQSIELYKQEGRERYLSLDEVGRLGDAISALVAEAKISIFSAAAIRLLIFTGARRSEILTLEWDWIDLDAEVINLPKSKTGKRQIELSAPAIALLRDLPQLPDNPYVCVGQRNGCHLVNIAKPWKLTWQRAGVKGCRVNDLRHTYASFLAADGHSLLLIGKLLGHTQPKTTARYAHLADDARRQANAALGEKLNRLVGLGDTT